MRPLRLDLPIRLGWLDLDHLSRIGRVRRRRALPIRPRWLDLDHLSRIGRGAP